MPATVMDLNPAQTAAVTTLSGPLLVLAGAGTGKTRVVTQRIARLIRHGIPPARVLAVTFTNKAAGEMQERVAALIGKRREEKPEISTFHSLCVRVLRRHIRHLGYPEAFAICDRGDQESLAKAALREIRVPETALRPGELLYAIGRWKTASIGPEAAATSAESDKMHLAAAAYRRYQRSLKAAGAVDFDDLLLCAEELFRKFPDVRREEAARFDHVLVDEYQDTNSSQYRIVKALAGRHRNLCVVGDDDQSIYGWRGADFTHILRFKVDWPEAKVVRLETNYRSTQEILHWANRLIAFNRRRHAKVLRATSRGEKPRILQLENEEAEAKAVVEEIGQRIGGGRRPRDFAVLFRTNEQTRSFEMEFRRAGVPYVVVGGMSFYDRKEVRDVLAYLKLLANPRDEVSLLRVINTPPRGIGQGTVTRLVEEAVAGGQSVWDLLAGPSPPDWVPPAAARGIGSFRELIARHRDEARRKPPVDVVRGILDAIRYREELARLYPDVRQQEARWAAVEELAGAAAGYGRKAKAPTLRGFLAEMALASGDDDRQKESQLARDAVSLMTLHAAKGLEFPEVYLVGMEEGLLPHRRSIDSGDAAVDEERRLCYVGLTRAERRLTLSLPLARQKWGKLRPTIASRFLYEITGQADNPNYLAAVRGQRPKRSAAGGGKSASPSRGRAAGPTKNPARRPRRG